jgi:hypothetical protein
MQTDFHHAVTYVVSRIAGFEHTDAEKIAYSAQYVDDAVNEGPVNFDNGALFNRNSSAHKMLDYRNMAQLANNQCWVSFHFLPGNAGLAAGENPEGRFTNKLVCTPNSFVAQDMLQACLENKHKPYALQQLGISMHVYADTWAHQGFVGITNDFNDIKEVNVLSDTPHPSWRDKASSFFGNLWDDVQSRVAGDVLPLGHGAVLSFPDMPYLHWNFTRQSGEVVERFNYNEYIAAAQHMCKFMQRWLGKDETGLTDADATKIMTLFRTIVEENGEKRHSRWLQEIADGAFSFGPQQLSYVGEGKGSWKYIALGEAHKGVYHYTPAFLQSNWKCFHDALLAHRFAVIHEILPRYGICIA